MDKNIDIRQSALESTGFESLNPMQEKMLVTMPLGRDILLLSPTGSGKTLAFLLPLWQALNETPAASTGQQSYAEALIIAPSRELVQQIADVWQRLHTGIRCIACYGGHDPRIEKSQLENAQQSNEALLQPLVIVGTPGRLKDHIERENLDPSRFTYLVIDEFDKSLELGFEDEMHAIIDALSGLSQRIFTSATHAVPIAPWTGFKDYEQVAFGHSGGKAGPDTKADGQEAGSGRLSFYQVKSPIPDKLETLKALICTLLSDNNDDSLIVFANYREAAERIAHYLSDQGIENALYHGGLEQDMRDKSIIRLRGGSIRVLVSTDLASRGLDLPEVAHIVHYHFPQSQEAYTHRNGRTARAGASGSAYVIVGPEEVLPEFFPAKLPYFTLRKGRDSIAAPQTVTVYIGRGKKEKISKGDVVGFFTKNGGITGADIGRIDIMDHCAYVALRRELAADVLAKVKGLKIKGEKTHYLIVSGS